MRCPLCGARQTRVVDSRDLDKIAYVRFASVYRSFDDLEDLKREVDNLFNQRDATGDAAG